MSQPRENNNATIMHSSSTNDHVILNFNIPYSSLLQEDTKIGLPTATNDKPAVNAIVPSLSLLQKDNKIDLLSPKNMQSAPNVSQKIREINQPPIKKNSKVKQSSVIFKNNQLEAHTNLRHTKSREVAINHLLHWGIQSFLTHYHFYNYKPTPIQSIIRIIKLFCFDMPKSDGSIDLNSEEGYHYLYLHLVHMLGKEYDTRTCRLKVFNFNLENLGNLWTKIDEAKNIIVLTGAGISTSLGIPDFRSKEGFYQSIKQADIEKYHLKGPEDVFTMDTFMKNPHLFYDVTERLIPDCEIFTPTHAFIRLLQDKGKLLRNYTQNIDNMEFHCGIEDNKLVQCHGSFRTASCVTCGFQCVGSEIFENMINKTIPKCPECDKDIAEYEKKICFGNFTNRQKMNKLKINRDHSDVSYGVIKPDITFFGQDLPQRFNECLKIDRAGKDGKCDLLICIGTSLKVEPVNQIVKHFSDVPQIYLNRDPVIHTDFDATFLGSSDVAVEYICQQMGWQFEHEMLKKKPLVFTEKYFSVFESKLQA